MASTVTTRELRGKDFSVHISEQTAKGSINATPTFTKYRRSEGTVKKAISYTEDPTVFNDFNGLEQIKESTDLTAELQAAFSKQVVIEMIRALNGTEVASTVTDTDIAATATGFTSASDAFDFLTVGDGVWIEGFADSTIDGFYIVATVVDDGEFTTTVAPAATEAATESITVTSNRTVNADTPTYVTGQERRVDTSKVGDIAYRTMYDGLLNSLSVEIPETGILTSTGAYVFEKEVDGYAAVSGQTDAAVPTDRAVTAVLGATASVVGFYEDGIAISCTQKSLSFEINNNLEKDEASACSALYFRSQPTFSGSMVMRTYTDNSRKWIDAQENETRKEFSVRVQHGGGDESYFVFYQTVLNEVTEPNANNAIANAELSFTAEGNTAAGATVGLFRNWS
jgi:hypothetical protein